MQTHSLLRIDCAAAVRAASTPAPLWVAAQLARTPWVVVRRAPCHDWLVPIGVRGGTRAERFAGWVQPESVRDCVSPLQLAARRDWCRNPRRAQVAALAALDEVEAIMARAGLAARWGVAGSVAFELASGCATTSGASDVDLIVQLDAPLPASAAHALDAELAHLAARADLLLETPLGAVALAEYAQAHAPYLVRTADGPRLLADPWAAAFATA